MRFRGVIFAMAVSAFCVTDGLIGGENDPMDAIQALAEKVIRNPYDLESFEKVRSLTDSFDYWLRFYGLEFVGQIGIRCPELRPKVIPILVRSLNEETDQATLRETVISIRDIGCTAVEAAWPHLISIVQRGEERDVTCFAAQALGKVHDPKLLGETVKVLVMAIARPPTIDVQVEAPAVRYYALDALVEIGKSGAAEVLGPIKEREKTADPYFEERLRRAIRKLEP